MRYQLNSRLLKASATLATLLATSLPLVAQTRGPVRQARPAETPKASASSETSLARQAHQLAKNATTVDDYTQALKICQQALRQTQSPSRKDYVQRLAAWIYNKRGEMLVELAENIVEKDTKRAVQYEEAALKDFDLAVKLDASSWKPRYNRAVSNAIVGEYGQAADDLTFVLEKQPDHGNARFNRAEIYFQLAEFEQAISDYSQVLSADPQDAAALSGRGLARFQLEQYDEALLDLNSAIRVQPNDGSVYANRADVYASLGQWERAAGDYRVAVSMDNQLGGAYHNVAWLMATCPDNRFRNPQLALRAARKAIELDGASYRYLDTLAAAQASAGKYDEARNTLLHAVEIAPQDELGVLKQRLALYQSRRPYREAARKNVRLASSEQ